MMSIETPTQHGSRQLSPLLTAWYAARAVLFYSGYALLTLWFGLTVLFVRPLGHLACIRYINYWNWSVIHWLRLTCGVRWQVEGLDRLPPRPYVIVAKHQSQWETFFLQLPFCSNSTILKQELLKIPVFGWGLSSVGKPIAIDRSQRREALKQILEQGTARLQEGLNVLIFPEGTHRPGPRRDVTPAAAPIWRAKPMCRWSRWPTMQGNTGRENAFLNFQARCKWWSENPCRAIHSKGAL